MDMLCCSCFVCEMDHLCDVQPLTFSLSNSNDGDSALIHANFDIQVDYYGNCERMALFIV